METPDGPAARLLHPPAGTLLAQRLALLPASPGAQVLEIAPRGAISSVLLASMVGPTGRVVSTFTDPAMAEHARWLLDQLKVGTVTVLQVDQHEHGAPDRAPASGYDAVVAWGSWPCLPDGWVKQTAPDGVAVVSLYLAPLVDAAGVCQIRCRSADTLQIRLLPGQPSPYDPWASRLPDYLDGIDAGPSGIPALVSGPSLRPADPTDPAQAAAVADRTARLLAALLGQTPGVRPSLEPHLPAMLGLHGQARADLRVWALVTEPDRLLTAAHGDLIGLFGYADPDQDEPAALLLHTATGAALSLGAHQAAPDALASLIGRWCAAGRPGWPDLVAQLLPTPGGWRLHAAVAAQPLSGTAPPPAARSGARGLPDGPSRRRHGSVLAARVPIPGRIGGLPPHSILPCPA